jgi:predicted DsbA family dithiol-disulfide isomerase/uncharacterized membrane protein
MKESWREYPVRAAALVGLGTSALLAAEYWQPALCGPGGGCDVVRASQYSRILGMPLPILGILFFAAILAAAVVPRLRRWLLPLGVVGAAVGVVLIGIQAVVLDTFCRFCVIVDVAALAAGAAAWSLRGRRIASPSFGSLAAQASVAAVVLVGPLLWLTTSARSDSDATAGEVPAVVKREQKPNLVTVVEFVDFECPACRAQHAQFESVLVNYAGKVDVVVKHMPLPNHENAVDAARAFCCAEERGAGREMADKLFEAERLAPEDCEAIAANVGLDLDDFRRCVGSERVTERLRSDQREALSIGIRGLPTFWIGEERFEGVHEADVLRSSIERALGRSSRVADPTNES